MSVALPLDHAVCLAPSFDRGVGPEATRLVQWFVQPAQRNSPSIAFAEHRRGAIEALMGAIAEAREVGWDGYAAKPANPDSVGAAVRFLGHLPIDTPLPEVSVDVDGDIALEWERGPSQVFSVRASRDGTLFYSGLVGSSTFHGSEPLRESIPGAVARGIDRALSGH
jgi:hypothetical protein